MARIVGVVPIAGEDGEVIGFAFLVDSQNRQHTCLLTDAAPCEACIDERRAMAASN